MSSRLASLDLVSRVALNDREAFALLYDRYAPLVFKLALRIVGDRAEAEDILQEAFLQVWRTAASYDVRRGQPSTWLVTIARSRAIDRLRSREQWRQRHGMPGVQFGKPGGANDLRQEMSEREGAAIVRSAVDSLPEEQRQAIELAYFDGLTQSEIARKLQKPVGTVKTRIRLGMMKLRDMLAVERGRTGK